MISAGLCSCSCFPDPETLDLNPEALHGLCAVASCTLGTYMGKGFMKTRRAFPQGVFAALSLVLSGGYLTSIL